MLMLTAKIGIPLSELEITFVRSSGPGGQHVNKVSTRAMLRWNAAASSIREVLPAGTLERFASQHPSYWTREGEIVLSSQGSRSARTNKSDCYEKLRTMLLAAMQKPKPRIPTKPTQGSIRRRLEQKARQAVRKQNRRRVEE